MTKTEPRWEGLAGEKGCKHCAGRGWHMVVIDPDRDYDEPTPCSWCLVPRSALARLATLSRSHDSRLADEVER